MNKNHFDPILTRHMSWLCCEWNTLIKLWSNKNFCNCILIIMCIRVNLHCNCLNVKELLPQNRCNILNLSNCNGNWFHNQLLHKRTFSHLAPLETRKFIYCFHANVERPLRWAGYNYLKNFEFIQTYRYNTKLNDPNNRKMGLPGFG